MKVLQAVETAGQKLFICQSNEGIVIKINENGNFNILCYAVMKDVLEYYLAEREINKAVKIFED